jgi:hypothetical protein
VSGNRLLMCAVLLYFTVDLSLTMMPGVFESDMFVDGTQTSRASAMGGGVMRLEPAVEPPAARPVPITAPDAAEAEHIALPHISIAFHRPRATLARASLDFGDPHSPVARL